jgi:hypothetical protein
MGDAEWRWTWMDSDFFVNNRVKLTWTNWVER